MLGSTFATGFPLMYAGYRAGGLIPLVFLVDAFMLCAVAGPTLPVCLLCAFPIAQLMPLAKASAPSSAHAEQADS